MAEFETACQRLGIRLFVLPPRSPKPNGHVERMQRTFRDELYTLPLPRGLARLQAELEAYLAYYNRRRPHMALGGLAPSRLPRLKCVDRYTGLPESGRFCILCPWCPSWVGSSTTRTARDSDGL
jgi:hypothetical protein